MDRFLKFALSLFTLVSVQFVQIVGISAQPTAPEMAAAQELFREAQQHQANKDWAACEAALQRAVAILETPGLRFHLAFCKEQQHRWVEALVDYRRAGELAARGDSATDVQELLPPATAQLERLTPKLELVVEEPPDELELFIDGKRVSETLLGTAFPVDPGGRRIEVNAPGYEPFSIVVNLLPEERRQVRVELSQHEPDPVVTQPPKDRSPKTAPRKTSGLSTQAIVLAGEALLTVGALAVGVGYSYEASSRERVRDQLVREIGDVSGCAPGQTPHALCASVDRASADADTARQYATIGYVGAGVGAAAFLATWLLWPDDDQPNDKQARTAGPGWQLNWSTDASSTSVSLSGRF